MIKGAKQTAEGSENSKVVVKKKEEKDTRKQIGIGSQIKKIVKENRKKAGTKWRYNRR